MCISSSKQSRRSGVVSRRWDLGGSSEGKLGGSARVIRQRRMSSGRRDSLTASQPGQAAPWLRSTSLGTRRSRAGCEPDHHVHPPAPSSMNCSASSGALGTCPVHSSTPGGRRRNSMLPWGQACDGQEVKNGRGRRLCARAGGCDRYRFALLLGWDITWSVGGGEGGESQLAPANCGGAATRERRRLWCSAAVHTSLTPSGTPASAWSCHQLTPCTREKASVLGVADTGASSCSLGLDGGFKRPRVGCNT